MAKQTELVFLQPSPAPVEAVETKRLSAPVCANSQAAHDTCMKHDANIPSASAECASGCDDVE